MKKLFLGSVALVALGLGTPTAFAAERAVPAPAYTPPPPPVPVYTWSGCYVGASAGYSWGTSNRTAVFNTAVPNAAGLPITGDFGLNGFIGGFQGGCNWQVGSWVIGFEGDGSATNKSGQAFGQFPFNGQRIHEISPSQARNLERATGAQVLDRTGVIMEIFHRHAHSREAKLQVEIARLKYVSPRLRESLAGGGRQQRSGAGESDLDLDRRKIRDRLAELKEQLEDIQRDNDQRRSARHDQLRVALVGYTNAGKSSLMRALTGSEVLVVDKLFATLDPTVRALKPETKPRVLVSDTVGFIKKLPHDLVASFRSTLAEALEASLLLFVVDASDPTHESQIEVSRNVLREIGAEVVPSRLLLNKIDRVSEADRAALRAKHPDAILLSAKSPEDVAALRDAIIAFFEAAMVEDQIVLPYAKQELLGDVYENAHVLSEVYDTTGRIMKVRGLPGAIARLRRTLATS
jgi:GTPase